MISGAMSLNPEREISISHLLKRVGKLMMAFLIWSFAYALVESLKTHPLFSSGYLLSVVKKTITGHYHMWYVYMISVLYLATPFLRPIAADRKLLRLFIFMAFLFNHGIRLFLMIPGLEDVTKSMMNSADIGIFSGYTGYYCLGYYLHSGVFSKKQLRKLFLVSTVLLAAVIAGGVLLDRPDVVFSEKMPHIFLYSASVFLLFKSKGEQLENTSSIRSVIEKIAPCTFGMYLVHPMFNFILRRAGLYALTFNPLICVPLGSILVFGASFAVIWCMRKFPIVKNFV
jgi:surface polysaccharide O-acyltransferase-like enzyme